MEININDKCISILVIYSYSIHIEVMKLISGKKRNEGYKSNVM